MKNLFLLFVMILLVITIKTKHNSDALSQTRNLIRIDVLRLHEIEKQFTLFIPRSVKFGAKLVNANKDGFIYITVNNKKYCYKRSVGITRNEYLIDVKCSEYSRTINVNVGDRVEVNFAKANMLVAENVPMFGEEVL